MTVAAGSVMSMNGEVLVSLDLDYVLRSNRMRWLGHVEHSDGMQPSVAAQRTRQVKENMG